MLKLLKELPGRLAALFLLLLMVPTMLLVWFLLRANTDEPVFVKQPRHTAERGMVLGYRFRTVGRGSAAFLLIGTYVRKYSLDESRLFALCSLVNSGWETSCTPCGRPFSLDFSV